jgi:dUTP pyrophosphatase
MLNVEPVDGVTDLKLPLKKNEGDAGWDVFCRERVTLQPGDTHQFKLGFRIKGERGKVYLVQDRSSLALRGLSVAGNIIDNGYEGECSVIMTNHSNAEEWFMEGDKIAQILVLPVEDDAILNGEELLVKLRGDQGYGSTGK